MRKNVMKKVTAAILAAAMVLSLTACGDSGKEPDSSTDTAQQADSADTADTADTADQTAAPEGEEAGSASGMDELIAAAQAEGSLTVYGLSLIHI